MPRSTKPSHREALFLTFSNGMYHIALQWLHTFRQTIVSLRCFRPIATSFLFNLSGYYVKSKQKLDYKTLCLKSFTILHLRLFMDKSVAAQVGDLVEEHFPILHFCEGKGRLQTRNWRTRFREFRHANDIGCAYNERKKEEVAPCCDIPRSQTTHASSLNRKRARNRSFAPKSPAVLAICPIGTPSHNNGHLCSES